MMGIYIVRNSETGAVYVGSSDDLEKRARQHWSRLRSGQHHNPRLQRDWETYRESAFQFRVLQEVEGVDQLIAVESQWVEAFREKGLYLYNEPGPVIDHRPQRRNLTGGPRLVSLTQAADELGIHYQTLRAWADAGKVPVVRMPSGHRRFERSAIERVKHEMGFTVPETKDAPPHDNDEVRPV